MTDLRPVWWCQDWLVDKVMSRLVWIALALAGRRVFRWFVNRPQVIFSSLPGQLFGGSFLNAAGFQLATMDKRRENSNQLFGENVSPDELLRDISTSLLASLPRADQRKKGVEYVRGLLEVPGRKSIRNIASLIGGRATDQSLHHFISESTWDWSPVRHALARYLVPRLPVEAWVVQDTVIRKAGQHSVGVDRRFVPAEGRVLNAQQAIGVWAASGCRSSPVDWGLHLPPTWIGDRSLRSRASIPDSTEVETLSDRAVRLCLGLASEWGMPVRPVVLDASSLNLPMLFDRLGRKGIPLLARVDQSVPLLVSDPALTGHRGSAGMPAGDVIRAASGTRQPVQWREFGRCGGVRSGLISSVAVRLAPGRTGRVRAGGGRRLALIGLAGAGQQNEPQLWLTNLTSHQPTSLLTLFPLLDRVRDDYREVAMNVGIEDYVGRSFDGWHRHMTLASAAHAIAVLTGPGQVWNGRAGRAEPGT
ncbi:transposase [Streptomyces sp. NPDC002055]|uniref:IS701 family transposase n=1 Tax=Streptomyces sp. NPDC002055 TaxID=3154534 RepID=UPI003327DFA8